MATDTDLVNFISSARLSLAHLAMESAQSVEARALHLTRMAQLRYDLNLAENKLAMIMAAKDYKPRHKFVEEFLRDRELDKQAAESAFMDKYELGFSSL